MGFGVRCLLFYHKNHYLGNANACYTFVIEEYLLYQILNRVLLTFIWCLKNWHNTGNNFVEFFLFVKPVILCWEMNIKNVGITPGTSLYCVLHSFSKEF